jgi:hypothetical protein
LPLDSSSTAGIEVAVLTDTQVAAEFESAGAANVGQRIGETKVI